MFASNSRYYGIGTYSVTLPDGRTVTATKLPLPGQTPPVGFHRRIQGDRLDLLAARFLKDPTYFWKICDADNAPSPEAEAARDLIGIPPGPATS